MTIKSCLNKVSGILRA